MALGSGIEWTEATWNPVTGCTRVSAGCDNSYAVSLTRRLDAIGLEKYRGLVNPGKGHFNGIVRTHEDLLEVPLSWPRSRLVFVNSMSDLFHPKVPDAFIQRVFETMKKASWHRFQILTKRPERVLSLDHSLDWSANVWMGVSVENGDVLDRIEYLRGTRARVRFLSLEPLLGPLPRIDLEGIDWVIVGGESGSGARPMEKKWVVDIRDQCLADNTPFFFKQWGGVRKRKSGRELDGRTWDQLPVVPAVG